MHDEKKDAQDDADEGEAEADYAEQSNEVFFAGAPGMLKRTGSLRRGRAAYGSRFVRWGTTQANPTRTNQRRLYNEPLRVTMHKVLLRLGRQSLPQDHPTINYSNLLT